MNYFDFETFLISSMFLLFTLYVWANEKQCEVWNNDLQCDGYHMHAFKMNIL